MTWFTQHQNKIDFENKNHSNYIAALSKLIPSASIQELIIFTKISGADHKTVINPKNLKIENLKDKIKLLKSSLLGNDSIISIYVKTTRIHGPSTVDNVLPKFKPNLSNNYISKNDKERLSSVVKSISNYIKKRNSTRNTDILVEKS